MAANLLTDQEVLQLLNDAEERLRTNGKNEIKVPNDQLKNLQRNISKIGSENQIKPYIDGFKSIPKIHLTNDTLNREKASSYEVRKVVDPVIMKKKMIEDRKATAGSDWYNLPRTRLSPELKRHLDLLRVREILDPKRHYKKDNMRRGVPEFSQVGTIIEGPTEYYSDRLTSKERKRTFVQEILENEKATGRYKKRYNEIQAMKTSGKKAFYKNLQSMRSRAGVLKQ